MHPRTYSFSFGCFSVFVLSVFDCCVSLCLSDPVLRRTVRTRARARARCSLRARSTTRPSTPPAALTRVCLCLFFLLPSLLAFLFVSFALCDLLTRCVLVTGTHIINQAYAVTYGSLTYSSTTACTLKAHPTAGYTATVVTGAFLLAFLSVFVFCCFRVCFGFLVSFCFSLFHSCVRCAHMRGYPAPGQRLLRTLRPRHFVHLQWRRQGHLRDRHFGQRHLQGLRAGVCVCFVCLFCGCFCFILIILFCLVLCSTMPTLWSGTRPPLLALLALPALMFNKR